MTNPRIEKMTPTVMTSEFIKNQNLSHLDAEWLRHRLRLVTDNVFLYNLFQNPIVLSLCKWDGTKWNDEPIGMSKQALLKQGDSAWVTLKPLGSGLIPGHEPQIVGQSILVVRPAEFHKDKGTFWQVDNISEMPLNAARFSGALSCSRTSVCQLLGSGYIESNTSRMGNLTTMDLDPMDAHWEYWFHEPPIQFDKPLLAERLLSPSGK